MNMHEKKTTKKWKKIEIERDGERWRDKKRISK